MVPVPVKVTQFHLCHPLGLSFEPFLLSRPYKLRQSGPDGSSGAATQVNDFKPKISRTLSKEGWTLQLSLSEDINLGVAGLRALDGSCRLFDANDTSLGHKGSTAYILDGTKKAPVDIQQHHGARFAGAPTTTWEHPSSSKLRHAMRFAYSRTSWDVSPEEQV
jgi:hypothetical protein